MSVIFNKFRVNSFQFFKSAERCEGMAEDVKLENESDHFDFENLKFYLPPSLSGEVPYLKNMLFRYLDTEFPSNSKGTVYSIPKLFPKKGEKQASLAEELVFQRLKNLTSLDIPDLWIIYFHSTAYAGYSNRNQRLGKLMIREHDFVVFAKYQGKYFVLLIEVKSTNDRLTVKDNIEVKADAKIIKNNKRSAQHQLRDHLEILQNSLGVDMDQEIQCYIMWPFLGAWTKDPKNQMVHRWAEDENLHVFEHTFAEQDVFNEWFLKEVISTKSCRENVFAHLLHRYIVLSCGLFMDEIDKNMLALLTQQQLNLLRNDICKKGGSLVVHGIAGTGKTLLVLKKLQHLYENGKLNAENKALYICYWPGIRCEVIEKLKLMGIAEYVDTARFYITSADFLKGNKSKYRHIFMDEAEAIILSFHAGVVKHTFYTIYKSYHDGNCPREDCSLADVQAFDQHSISTLLKLHIEEGISLGELWFMVDTNQALMFLPKHSPAILKKPQIVLNKLIRSTKQICTFFSAFTNQTIQENQINFPKVDKEPPIFWVRRNMNVSETVSEVIVDLCSTKGVKPRDICVIPFLQNERLSKEAINSQICQKFAENAFQPEGVSDVERFLLDATPNKFLIAWALRVKGLEFKVVIMVIDKDQFDKDDPEDRRRIYVIASRCTCMLVIISDDGVKHDTGLERFSEDYCFNLKFKTDE